MGLSVSNISIDVPYRKLSVIMHIKNDDNDWDESPFGAVQFISDLKGDPLLATAVDQLMEIILADARSSLGKAIGDGQRTKD